ncbi:MAG: 1-phosphofructokinase family hexose kinase [Saprospiraceae bacterium]
MKIVTLTVNAALDISTAVDKLLPEAKLRCEAPRYDPGGGGVNVARVIKRLGGEALAVLQSSGSPGAKIEQLLQGEGVAYQSVPTQEWTRESVTVLDKGNGLQYRFVLPGPTLSEAECQAFFQAIRDLPEVPAFLVGSGSLPPGVPVSFYADLAQLAKELDTKLIVDTSGPGLKAAVEAGVFMIKPNLKELSALTGKAEVVHEEQEAMAKQLIAEGKCEMVVVSLGARGAMLASREGIVYATPPTVKVRSTVGAGDSMVAGMVWALAQGWDCRRVLQYGVACGTATTMNEGTGLCQKQDVEAIFRILQEQVL